MPRTSSHKPPETVTSAAASNNSLKTLLAMRAKTARAIDECESWRDLAPLNRSMADILAQIEKLRPAEKKGDAVDEIAQRRAARRSSAASGSARSKRPG